MNMGQITRLFKRTARGGLVGSVLGTGAGAAGGGMTQNNAGDTALAGMFTGMFQGGALCAVDQLLIELQISTNGHTWLNRATSVAALAAPALGKLILDSAKENNLSVAMVFASYYAGIATFGVGLLGIAYYLPKSAKDNIKKRLYGLFEGYSSHEVNDDFKHELVEMSPQTLPEIMENDSSSPGMV